MPQLLFSPADLCKQNLAHMGENRPCAHPTAPGWCRGLGTPLLGTTTLAGKAPSCRDDGRRPSAGTNIPGCQQRSCSQKNMLCRRCRGFPARCRTSALPLVLGGRAELGSRMPPAGARAAAGPWLRLRTAAPESAGGWVTGAGHTGAKASAAASAASARRARCISRWALYGLLKRAGLVRASGPVHEPPGNTSPRRSAWR